jgi:hypothetical protein
MFDPALAGYWGASDLDAAMTTAVEIINDHASKVDGVKISLLDKDKEIAMRRRLSQGVLMYTGDDFNYAELIAGDAKGYSHALLGIFDTIAPAASAALVKLAAGDAEDFHNILALLQNRCRVHGLSQRSSGSFYIGRRPGERALKHPSRGDIPPCR